MANFKDIINTPNHVLIDFFAEWCGPCKTMAPILKDVKLSIGDKVTIIKIDIDKNQALANEYQIRSVPTLLLFKDGKVIWKQSGIVLKQELLRLLSQHQ